MFRGFAVFCAINILAISAYSKSCNQLFQPSLKLVQVTKQAEEFVERDISRDFVNLLYSQNIIKSEPKVESEQKIESVKIMESDAQLFKLRELAAEYPFLYEAFHNISLSHRYLEEKVNRSFHRQLRSIEMAYASGTSQVFMEKNHSENVRKNIDNKKVVSLSEVREKHIKEEKEEYETIIAQQYSEMNYGFFHQLYNFFFVIHSKLNVSPTVKLTQVEYQTMKEVAENFKIYSNYLLSKEILQYMHKASKELTIELTAVLTRSPKLKDKFIEYLSFMERALQEQKFDEVLNMPAVQRAQKQLLIEVKEVHLQGTEKRYAEVIQFLEGRLEN
ncbi:MAG: hypothetical protein MK008_04420 [Bdellovibrionales bacterium]|nr:hypothetical protein [Bdellovibrionales bacterium]